MAYVREALKQFVEKRMRPGDLVAIIRTSAGMGALQQFTSDKRQLYAAIERVRYNFMGRSSVSAFAPLRGPATPEDTGDAEDRLDEFRTELFSVGTLGAINFVVRGLKDLPGRKSVVVLSDGFKIFGKDRDNTRVLDSLKRLTDMANRASVVIYTIDARGLPTLTLTAADDTSGLSSEQPASTMQARSQELFESQDGLSYLAQETGGLFFHSSNDIGGEIGRVVDDQKGYYLIGYTPEESTFRGQGRERPYHKITVRVKRAGLRVRSRSGFFGMPDEQPPPGPRTPVEQLQTALTSPFASGGIHLRLTSLFGHSSKKGSLVRSVLHINGRDLSFTKDEEDWNKAVVDIMAVTFGDDGTAVDQITKTYTIKVRGESYEQALKYGLIYNMNVPIKKPGPYQLRIAVRDSTTSHVGSASQFIEVPDIGKGRLILSGIAVSASDGSVPKKAPAPATPTTSAAPAVSAEDDGELHEPDPEASLAVRRFRRGMLMNFVLLVYNAKLDHGKGQLDYQVRLFHDGRQVYAGPVRPVDMAGQPDMKRLLTGGQLRLGTNMEPGDYVLQILVTDRLAKEKYRTAAQWMDFEVVR
jgi:VWFA-related protein